MTAIRNYSTNVPHVFRYPRWAPDVFYPASSLVSFPYVDSDGVTLRYNYYTSSKDIGPGNGSPYENFDWFLVFDITEAQRVQRNDSDIYRAINNLDSDMAAALEIVRLQSDSDNIVSVNDHDSDIAMAYHDFKAADSDASVKSTKDLDSEILARKSADSDILYLMERIRLQVDSDNIVKVSDYDSDRARETHDRKASDSDIKAATSKNLDSEILARKSADSDIRVSSSKNLDSEILARKSADSDILWLMERIRLQVDSDNIVKVSDYDSDRAKLRHDFKAADSDLNFITIGDVAEITQDMTGFVDRTQSALSWNNTTRTLTLTPTSSSFDVYRKGVSHTITSAKSVTISNVGGGRYIKYDPVTQQLVDYGVGGNPDFTNDIIVSYVYWDTVTSRGIIVADERHGAERDTTWHKAQHFNVGAVWRSGGAVAATLNDPAAVKIGLSNPIIIADEDIEHTITNSASPTVSYEQTLDPVAKIPVLWVNGDPGRYSQAWNNNDSDITWLYGPNRAYYNPIVGNVGTLTEISGSGAKFLNYWIIGTNDTRWPIKALIGQSIFNNHDDADAEEFAKYDLPIPEMVPMYKVTLEVRSNYTQNPAKVRIHSVQLMTANNTSVINSFNTQNHNLLLGRGLDDAHPIKAITGLEERLKALENFDSDALNGTMYDYGTF